jgi:hypothetical protein
VPMANSATPANVVSTSFIESPVSKRENERIRVR